MWQRIEDKGPASGLLVKDLPTLDIQESERRIIITFPYSILLTHACDLDEFCKCIEKKQQENQREIGRQIITQMIFCPAFDEASFALGTHLREQYDYQMPIIHQNELKSYKEHRHIRYHYIESSIREIPDFIVDFKQYFTVPAMFVVKYIRDKKDEYYKLTHLHYTSLADRFAHYLQRVAIYP